MSAMRTKSSAFTTMTVRSCVLMHLLRCMSSRCMVPVCCRSDNNDTGAKESMSRRSITILTQDMRKESVKGRSKERGVMLFTEHESQTMPTHAFFFFFKQKTAYEI